MAAGLLALAGCGGATVEDLLLACPQVSMPGDLRDLTLYRDGAVPDLTNLVLDARMVEARGPCSLGRRSQSVQVRLTVGFEVERGPAAQGRAAELPWLLALVSPEGEVVSRQTFRLPVVFAPNVTRANVSAPPIEVDFPARARTRIQDWRVVAGFQLDEAQLALNRRRGPR
ncbi:MAG: hypothetical protein K2X11_20940 [Acetobacteraceae bacterium]|nr:hypothetical protein [Acetobacteraceae bacterium]